MTEAMMQYIMLSLQLAPQLVSLAEQLGALRAGATPEQQMQIDTALALAHKTLQEAQPSA